MLRHAVPVAACALASLLLALPAEAQQRAQAAPPGPRALGVHGAWTAAAYAEGGGRVCYAFARPARSEGAPPNRGAPMLTITHRPNGRDQVSFSTGYALGRQAAAVLVIGGQEHRSFAVQGTTAFFQGGPALVAALRNGREAVIRVPGPTGRPVTDSFALTGLGAALDAIGRECPAQRPA